MKSQKGFGLFQIAFFGIVLGLGGLYGVKIGMPYFDQKHMQSVVQQKLKEAQTEKLSDDAIRRSIWNSSNVNGTNLPFESITVDHDNGKINVNIDWKPSIPLWKGAVIILDLGIKESVDAPN